MSDEQGYCVGHIPAALPAMRNGHWCSDLIEVQHDLAREQEQSKELRRLLSVAIAALDDEYPETASELREQMEQSK